MLDRIACPTSIRHLARLAHTFALATMLSAPVRAASTLNLRWDACIGDGGVSNKSFACNTNIGTNTIVGSWVSPVGVHELFGNDFVLDLEATGPAMPAWWGFRNAGSCRPTSLLISSVIPATAQNCLDWTGGGQGNGFIVSYDNPGPPVPSARLRASTTAPPDPVDVLAGQEYFSFALRIDNMKTVGAGACGGCDVPVCIALEIVDLNATVYSGDTELFIGRQAGDKLEDAFVLWQPAAGQKACAVSVPVRNRTWGELKALYR